MNLIREIPLMVQLLQGKSITKVKVADFRGSCGTPIGGITHLDNQFSCGYLLCSPYHPK